MSGPFALGEPHVMDGDAAAVVEMTRGVRAAIGVFAAVALLGVGLVMAQALGSPSAILGGVMPGGSLWFLLPLLLIPVAGGLGGSVRAILGLDAVVARDPVTGIPRFSLRRAVRELPLFWLFAVSSLLTAWGYAGFVLFGSVMGPPGSSAAAACGAAMLLGSTLSAIWMVWVAVGRKDRAR